MTDSSINIPLVVSLLGPPGQGNLASYEAALTAAFAGGAESILRGVGAAKGSSAKSSGGAPMPILLLTLEDNALLSLAQRAKAAAEAGGHKLRLYAMRVGTSQSQPPSFVDRLWEFPTAANAGNQTFDLLAAGTWLALRAQVRLFVGEVDRSEAARPKETTQLSSIQPADFWLATARAGRVYADELALAPFYDKGHRPFQPPVRRLDEAERGPVGFLRPDAKPPLELVHQLEMEHAGSHHGKHTWEFAWAEEHLAPIARWNMLPIDWEDKSLTEQSAWQNLTSADNAQGTVTFPANDSRTEIAEAYVRVQLARKGSEDRNKCAQSWLLGADWASESLDPGKRSIALLLASVLNLSFAACVSFACYAKLYPHASHDPHHIGQLFWIIVFLGLAAIAAGLATLSRYQLAKRFDEDLRGLREALRVQLFFWMARDPEFAADQFPRGHRGRLGAVRIAAANLALVALRSSDWPNNVSPTREQAQSVHLLWVRQQATRLVGREPSATRWPKDERKQGKLGQFETLEACTHGLSTGLTLWAVAGAALHGVAILGHQEWMPIHYEPYHLILGIGGLGLLGLFLFVVRTLMHSSHHHRLHSIPLVAGFVGGAALVGVWADLPILFGCILHRFVRVDADSMSYWWVSGCVLTGLLAGILHTRYHLLNLDANLTNARATGVLHEAADRALEQILANAPTASSSTAQSLGSASAHEFREYVRELGRCALAEDSRWLLEHRARPLTLPHLT